MRLPRAKCRCWRIFGSRGNPEHSVFEKGESPVVSAPDVERANRSARWRFRLDASDCMLSIFLFRGNEMFEQLVRLALQTLQSREWRGLEASLFCLNALADNVVEIQTSEDVIQSIFSSSLFAVIADSSQPIALQTRSTWLTMTKRMPSACHPCATSSSRQLSINH